MTQDTITPRRMPRKTIGIAVALLALGGAAGAVAVAETRPSISMAPATPVAIRSLQSDGIVTIRGRVAEVYGNKFVMADGSGRALVDTGGQGEDGGLVTANQAVTVQGRFEHGFVHAAFLVGADGKVTALGPIDGPRHPHRGPGPHDRGPDGPDGPDGDRPAPPPPPAPNVAAPTAAAPTAATPTAAAPAPQAS